MSGMSVASGRTTKTGATGDGEETSWILDVVVRDKCIKVTCGDATQRVTSSAGSKLSRRGSATAESRPPRHQRDASSMAWRRGLSPIDSASTATFSPREDLVENYRTRLTG